MKILTSVVGALALILLTTSNQVYAQFPGGTPSAISPGLVKLFGENNAFSAKAEMQMADPESGKPMSITSSMAFLNGKIRSEIDLSAVSGMQFPAEALAQMKQLGLDRVVSIVEPGKPILLIYPNIKGVLHMPVQENKTDGKDATLTKTEQGKETIDGHPCTKQKVTVTQGNEKQDFLVWSANDMKNFPLRIQTLEQEPKVTVTFKNVSFTKPDAAQFEAPKDYKKYDNMLQLMMEKMGNTGDK
jgi:hypothetical protein